MQGSLTFGQIIFNSVVAGIGGGASGGGVSGFLDTSTLPPKDNNDFTIGEIINQIVTNLQRSDLAGLILYQSSLSGGDFAHALAQLGGSDYLRSSHALFTTTFLSHNTLH